VSELGDALGASGKIVLVRRLVREGLLSVDPREPNSPAPSAE